MSQTTPPTGPEDGSGPDQGGAYQSGAQPGPGTGPYQGAPYAGQHPGGQYAGAPYGGMPYTPRPPTNTMAVVSLACGIAGLTILPLLGSIVAVIVGPMARREISRSGEEGGAFATAGIVTGWVGIGIYGLAILAVIAMLVFSFGMFTAVAGATSGLPS